MKSATKFLCVKTWVKSCSMVISIITVHRYWCQTQPFNLKFSLNLTHPLKLEMPLDANYPARFRSEPGQCQWLFGHSVRWAKPRVQRQSPELYTMLTMMQWLIATSTGLNGGGVRERTPIVTDARLSVITLLLDCDYSAQSQHKKEPTCPDASTASVVANIAWFETSVTWDGFTKWRWLTG